MLFQGSATSQIREKTALVLNIS